MKFRFTLMALVLAGWAMLPGQLSAQEAVTGPDTVVFTPKRGTVTFAHGKHSKATECKTCHHESRPEKPATAEYQKCSACHTTPATEPMKTTLRNAMHNTAAEEGTCFTCHKAETAKGTAGVPAKCADCHKLEG